MIYIQMLAPSWVIALGFLVYFITVYPQEYRECLMFEDRVFVGLLAWLYTLWGVAGLAILAKLMVQQMYF